METGLLHLHNLLRWVILLLLVLSTFNSYTGWKKGRTFSAGDRKIWLFTMIASHLTLLLGLYQWLAGRYGLLSHERPEGVSMMKNPFYRYYQLEHPVNMIIAILLVTLAYGMAKKPLADAVKYKKAFWLFLIALVLILIRMPWPFLPEVGRPLLPGM
ncbi:MAG: hypothetical protein FJX89_09585 [Bacteroidetes bacterium]|nr:hypothetical protein [Bacteroidota bacterium]